MMENTFKIRQRVRLVKSQCGTPRRYESQIGTVTEINCSDYYVKYDDGGVWWELEDSLADAEPVTFKVGDKVRITGKVKATPWISPMDKYIGKIGTVSSISCKGSYVVDGEARCLYYNPRDLELVTESEMEPETMKLEDAYKTMQAASGIEVGDRVKILRTAQDHEMGWQNTWNSDMNDTVGETGEVIKVSGSIEVHFDQLYDWWNYPFFVLEVVEKDKKATTKPAALTIRDVPVKVLRTIRDKWQAILDRGELEKYSDWNTCEMCRYMTEIYDNKCDDRQDLGTEESCPLWKPGWCRSRAPDSLLGDYDEDCPETWRKNVAEFICWINKELATRKTP